MHQSLKDFDTFIFDEMMTHPALFTHKKPSKIALINSDNESMVAEILKHLSVTEVCQINCLENKLKDRRIKQLKGDIHNLHHENFNIIISLNGANTSLNDFYLYLDMLADDGILIQESGSLFNLDELKNTFLSMYHAGFHDLQLVHFPQPSFESGWRAAMMGAKTGIFERIREKDIFNKPFATRYYNFDMHKAALVLPEFIREELAV